MPSKLRICLVVSMNRQEKRELSLAVLLKRQEKSTFPWQLTAKEIAYLPRKCMLCI